MVKRCHAHHLMRVSVSVRTYRADEDSQAGGAGAPSNGNA